MPRRPEDAGARPGGRGTEGTAPLICPHQRDRELAPPMLPPPVPTEALAGLGSGDYAGRSGGKGHTDGGCDPGLSTPAPCPVPPHTPDQALQSGPLASCKAALAPGRARESGGERRLIRDQRTDPATGGAGEGGRLSAPHRGSQPLWGVAWAEARLSLFPVPSRPRGGAHGWRQLRRRGVRSIWPGTGGGGDAGGWSALAIAKPPPGPAANDGALGAGWGFGGSSTQLTEGPLKSHPPCPPPRGGGRRRQPPGV